MSSRDNRKHALKVRPDTLRLNDRLQKERPSMMDRFLKQETYDPFAWTGRRDRSQFQREIDAKRWQRRIEYDLKINEDNEWKGEKGRGGDYRR